MGRWVSAHDLFNELSEAETELAFTRAGGERFAFELAAVPTLEPLEEAVDAETTGTLPALA